MRREVHDQGHLHEKETRHSEKDKDEEMRPRPGDAQVFGQGWARSVRSRRRGSIANGIASERGIGIFPGARFGCSRERGVRFGERGRFVVEEGHRVFSFALLPGVAEVRGQPLAKAAATKGRSSS